MILTSYFGRLKALREAELYEACLPICRHNLPWLPRDLTPRRELTLAPPAKLLSSYKKGAISWSIFSERYQKDILDHHDIPKLIDRLHRRANDQDPVLLCYCGPDKPCHRHLISTWLRDHGFDAEEWEPPGSQQKLF